MSWFSKAMEARADRQEIEIVEQEAEEEIRRRREEAQRELDRRRGE